MIDFFNVRFGYSEEKSILKDISLHIPRGKITALLGPNGTGKTTLINLALGWLKPSRGQIQLDGKELHRYSKRELSRMISLVPQAEVLPFHLQVLEFVLFGRTPYLKPLAMPGVEDVDIARAAMRRLGIEELERRYVNSLSGGEKHMVLLARSLTQQARCILMDEPTNHMDPSNRLSILRTIKDLAGTGNTILFSTHHPEIALELAENTICIKEGLVVHAGPSSRILNRENLMRLYGVEAEIWMKDGKQLISWQL